jgi:large repetitive protein
MPELALYDLVSPYVLKGDTFGQWHAALSVIFVAEHTVTVDDGGIVIRGVARFSGDVHPFIDPDKMTFGVDAENTEGHPANDAGRRNPWIDVRDAHIDFELSAPREISQKIASAVTAIGAGGSFQNAAAVLKAYDTADPPPSDYGSTNFTIDMILTTVVLRPPFLIGAKLDAASGILVEDPNNKQIKFSLPKIKVRLSQGSKLGDPLQAALLSLGASGLDDRDDFGVAQLVTMDPPYAFVGPSKIVGFGFRSATLDLSDGSTPPDVLAQFGYDDSWTGLYLPELRLFIAPHGAQDLAFDGSATNLLIGFGASAGVTGDFELGIVDQGSGEIKVSARFYDANNRAYGITKTSDTTATVSLPARTRLVVDIDGGLTPYIASAQIGAAADLPGRLFDVDFGSSSTLTIVITATGSQPGATPVKLTITANRKAAPAALPPGSTTSPDTPGVQVETTTVTLGAQTVSVPQLKLVSQTTTQATIALDTDAVSAGQTHWTMDGADKGLSAVLTVDCAEGASVNVKAELPGQTGVGSFTAYYRFDHPSPPPHPQDPVSFTVPPDNTHTTPAVDTGAAAGWVGGSDVQIALNAILDNVSADTKISISGYSSFETGDKPDPSSEFQYNKKLANNRAVGLQAMFERYPTKTFQYPGTKDDMTNWGPAQGDPSRNVWWKAVATWQPVDLPGTVTTGTVTRKKADPVTPPPPPDNPAAAPTPTTPSWFKKIDVKVRIVRNHFVACEISGKFDIQTPTESQLAAGGVAHDKIPQWGNMGSQNPGDGIVEAKLIVQIDDAKDTVIISGSFGADPADIDGLLKMGWINPPPDPLPGPTYGLNFLGLAVAFWPLIADAASATSNNGNPVELVVTGVGFGVVAAMAGLYLTPSSVFVLVERVVWYGGEFEVQVRPDGDEVMILVDIEAAISAEVALGPVKILSIDRKSPLVVRYKAIGFIIGNKPGEAKFPFRPYFDSSKGYSIDVSKPGTIKVGDPFDKILKILGARMARNNPFMIEVDLGFSADLGIVSVERCRVRMNLNPVSVELTAFTASVDVPGALRGTGSIEMGSDAQGDTVISGFLDITIVPVEIRIAATLQIAQITAANGGPATGVKVSLEVDFPVAIPLATSGIGIYGFLGLFAVNFERDESKIANSDQPAMAPALAWLRATGGDPTNNDFWIPKVNHWAFGVGALLGTEGSDFILNLKGMFLLELPGPRLLLMMKANLIAVAPPTKGNAEGVFLAVLDLDFGRGTLTIGLSLDFSIDDQIPILKLKIPVEAFFDFNDTSNWHLYLGTFSNMVQAVVLGVFDASGYVMLSGKGIDGHSAGISGNPLPPVTGFSIGAGLHVSFKWGGGPLYAELAAGFDAVIGFSPFRAAGVLYVRGSLHLFIIDISAWAELAVDIGDDGHGGHICQITGDICGKVDFFFFSISGCVSFTLGGDAVPVPAAPPLVKSLKLVSRSPALVAGTGVGKKIDCALADAVEGDGGQPAGALPIMPLDIVPAIMMAVPPMQDAALKFLGQDIGGTPQAPFDGWVQRGDMWYRYTLKKVELVGPLTAGATPAVWWNTKAGDKALEAQLALLSWKPDPTPTAVGSSKYLNQTVKEKWGTTCNLAAPPAPVLWTFFFQVLGPSVTGWDPFGLAQPDPPNTVRSSPPDLSLHVSERWRCGNGSTDNMRGIVPAEIQGAAVACPGTNAGNPPAGPAVVPPVRVLPAGGVLQTLNPGNVVLPSILAAAPLKSTDPIVALRGLARQTIDTSAPLSLYDIVQKAGNGEAISRAALTAATFMGAAANAPGAVALPCFGWALASPIFDDSKLVAFGDQSVAESIKIAWSKLHFQPGPLDDAVVINFGGPFEYARFFLWIPERLITGGVVVVAASDAKDSLINPHPITPADKLPPAALPSTWTAATSPWNIATTVLEELVAIAETVGYIPVTVLVKGGAGTDRVQIGCTRESRQIRNIITLRPFYVGGIEALKSAEVARADYDNKEQKKKQGVLNNAFGVDSKADALLQKDTTYSVSLTYTSESQQRKQGQDPSDITTAADQVQAFWFKTDATPPPKLDPWILMSLPADAEKHYFAAEDIKVVFGTNNVAQLYDAYDMRLQARLRPSSFVPVPSTPSVPHPVPLAGPFLQSVNATVLPPWDNAVKKLMSIGTTGKDINGKRPALPCVATSGDLETHSMVTIPITLDLFTDYVIDIEMVDKAAPDPAVGKLVWRSSFSTGAFLNETDFATSFQISKINHRGVMAAHNGQLQAIGAKFAGTDPEGSEFDDALIAAGLDALPVPKYASFTVFWESTGATPQPVAVLVDAAEPMWRERPIPTQITDPGPAASQWYELQNQPWLEMTQNGGDGIVDEIVFAPGSQRALVTLKAGARGQHLMLALKRMPHIEPYLDGPGATAKFFPILNTILTAAPWEEVD